MSKSKKIFTDPSFWMLLIINGYLVYHYYQHPEIFTTLLWLYWAQSVMLGFFNFIDILTVRNVKKEDYKENGVPKTTSNSAKVPAAIFFAFHYGFFHFVYFFFLLSMKGKNPIQWEFFKYFFYAFVAAQIINFIQHKIQQRKQQASLTNMFITPYLRVVPMHLTILLPRFFNISGMGIFLILKSLADVLMYLVTKPANTGRETDTTILAAQQGMNMNS